MSTPLCPPTQDLLAEGGVDALTPRLREHVADCGVCSDLLLALSGLDEALATLPVPPLPEGLNARVEAAVASDVPELEIEPDEPAPRRFWPRRPSARVQVVVAASVVILMSLATVTIQLGGKVKGLYETADAEIDTVDANLDGPAYNRRPAASPASPAVPEPEVAELEFGLGGEGRASGLGGMGRRAGRLDRDSDAWRAMDPDGDGIRNPTELSGKNFGDIFRPEVRQRVQKRRNRTDSITILSPSRTRRGRAASRAPEGSKQVERAEKKELAQRPVEEEPAPRDAADGTVKDLGASAYGWESSGEEIALLQDRELARGELRGKLKTRRGPSGGDFGEGEDGKASWGLRAGQDAGQTEGQSLAAAWLAERARLDAETQPAEGYWSNTYVPGDPVLRRLENRVRRAREQKASRGDLAAGPVAQPFDPPTDGALGVYLHSDRRGITEPTRMRIQVGLQGTERGSGRRPAMNVGLVLDLRGTPTDAEAQAVRALVESLSQAKDLGDTFSLTVAGRPGGQVVPAGSFRHGPVQLALDEVLGNGAAEGPTLDLRRALQVAIGSVGETDDPARPLGSSVVLLVSPRDLSADVQALQEMAHSSAVAGIPVSVVGVGTRPDVAGLDAIALAGQGSRRLLADASGAAQVIDRELSASSQAIARAVRLRIRLAPGVELVDVLGSQRLDAVRSEQVREAEKSIDQRLSRNLGIEADRGEDEEGIQMVIPAWYAGDGHAIVLDVIAPGPGAVADVTVRYKDLVRLDNGVARASLSLGRDPAPPGPLELNVTKNEVAQYLSEQFAMAAESVRGGDAVGAQAVLDRARFWLEGLQVQVPALAGDRELQRDHQLLAAYARVLGPGTDMHEREFLKDALHLSARRKVLAPPADDSIRSF